MAEEQKQPTVQEIPEPQQQAMQSQVTSQTPAIKPAKNPKRVAAGKMVAEKTRQAREAKEKALAEAHAEIEKYKKAELAEAHAEIENYKKAPPAPEPETEPKPAADDSKGSTTNQWLTIIGIFVALFTTYVKRDDIKTFFTKKQAPPPEPQPKEPAPLPQPPLPQRRKGTRKMD